MEITPLMIYFIAIADNIISALSLIILSASILGPVSFLASLELCDSDELRWRWTKRFLIAYATCVVLLVITPSSKTLVAMYVIPPIANNQEVQELPKEVLSFVNEYLKDQEK